ncbi:MAG: hypothetical protein MJZ59_05465 [Paludibacteraceae bacterium]|nr:hypothetical protein [Paludibacteraceae bacterium]
MKTTIYEYLLEKQASGEIKVLFALGLSTSIPTYMQIYKYHLTHPQESQFEVSLAMDVSKPRVQRAYFFMSQIIDY